LWGAPFLYIFTQILHLFEALGNSKQQPTRLKTQRFFKRTFAQMACCVSNDRGEHSNLKDGFPGCENNRGVHMHNINMPTVLVKAGSPAKMAVHAIERQRHLREDLREQQSASQLSWVF
jgi:hypothetical protein